MHSVGKRKLRWEEKQRKIRGLGIYNIERTGRLELKSRTRVQNVLFLFDSFSTVDFIAAEQCFRYLVIRSIMSLQYIIVKLTLLKTPRKQDVDNLFHSYAESRKRCNLTPQLMLQSAGIRPNCVFLVIRMYSKETLSITFSFLNCRLSIEYRRAFFRSIRSFALPRMLTFIH